MKIIRAEHLGMCFGVRDAITLALRQSQVGPLTVLGELVHNESVLAELRAKGIKVCRRLDEKPFRQLRRAILNRQRATKNVRV